jgi:hypothetical protein
LIPQEEWIGKAVRAIRVLSFWGLEGRGSMGKFGDVNKNGEEVNKGGEGVKK